MNFFFKKIWTCVVLFDLKLEEIMKNITFWVEITMKTWKINIWELKNVENRPPIHPPTGGVKILNGGVKFFSRLRRADFLK